MTARSHPQARRFGSAGFSLAESLFALSIFAFVLLAMISMVPNGLAQLKDAERRAAEARILQTMLADFEGRKWINLATQGTVTTYFDDEGVAMKELYRPNAPTKAPNYVVSAMLVQDPQNLAAQGKLPGERKASKYLRYVRMAICAHAQDPEAVSQMRAALISNRPAPFVTLRTFVLADLEPAKGVATTP